MSKELTPFQALEDLVNLALINGQDGIIRDYYNVIVKALEDYELMKNTKFIVIDKNTSDDILEKLKNQRMFVDNLEECEIKPLFDKETTKKLKALEIIKNKKVALDELLRCIEEEENELEEYNNFAGDENSLSQEEFDLLKEALLWHNS